MMGVQFFLVFLCSISCVSFLYAEEKKGANLTPSVMIDPFIHIVKATDPGDLDLSFSEKDIENARNILLTNRGVKNVYQKIGSFSVCVLSNDRQNALVLKVAKSENPDNLKEVSDVDEMTMYNASTGHQIRTMLVVKPAGWTMNSNAFGNSSTDDTPSEGISFMVGGPVITGNEYSVHLQSREDSNLNPAVALTNLELDSYGMVNHYGLNADLSERDVDVEFLEHESRIKLKGCQGYNNSSETATSIDMSIIFDLYVYVPDLLGASAGEYNMQFSTHWADSNDLSDSTVVYGTRS